MDWKAHVAMGAVISAFVFYFVLNVREPLTLFQFVFVSALSALIPDLDHEISKGKRLLDLVAIVFALFFAFSASSLILFFVVLGIYFIAFKLLKPRHRGITHSLVACLGFSVLVYFLAELNFAIAVFMGYLSHLVADRF